jgi:hypothetical protein
MNYEYGVIYTVDVPKGTDPMDYAPPHVDKWELTEDDKDALESFFGKGGHHRKWAALLKQQEFDEFVEETGLYAEDVETEGAIGVPGCPLDMIEPAISFVLDESEVLVGAYVTPLPPENSPVENDEKMWNNVRKEMLDRYGIKGG